MPVVQCPDCPNRQEVPEPPRYAGDEFCRQCGYPLFWAPREAPSAASAGGAPVVTFRSPGVQGVSMEGAVICPNCKEPNVPGNVYCVRCQKDLPPR
jgi:hypothetical protein